MEFFGVLNSVTYTVSTAFTCLIYPLQLITTRQLGGNNTPVTLLFGGINIISMVAIAGLMWLEKRKKFGSRKEANSPMEGLDRNTGPDS